MGSKVRVRVRVKGGAGGTRGGGGLCEGEG